MQADCITSEDVAQKETEALTCGLQEASKITGIGYERMIGYSKDKNPHRRPPGFAVGKSGYRVIVAELPAWLRRMAGLE